MREIKIRRFVLDNFKCHQHLVLDMDGRNVSLYGDNATGKTSVYDALTWLLFGKDSAGNGEKNVEIKPLDSFGTVLDHNAITSVEAELDVSGEITVLKRTYREVSSTKRGSSQETYDGNTSEYFVDGVPCKKYVFEAKIQELVPEEVFRLLTSVGYFANGLRWQDRRGILFDMAGTLSDREIMAADVRFLPLLEGMGKLSLEDYKKKLAAEKRGVTGVRDQLPARMSECQKTVEDLAGLDFAGARAALKELEGLQREVSARLIPMDHGGAADAKRLGIREAEMEAKSLDRENAAYRANQEAGATNTEALKRHRNSLYSRLSVAQNRLAASERRAASLEKSIDTSRQRWIEINGELFSGGTCPTCGQQLPLEQLQRATDAFERSKRQRLDEVVRTADMQKAQKIQEEEAASGLREEIQAMEGEIRNLDQDIQAAEAARIDLVDMEGYQEQSRAIQGRLSVLRKELTDILMDSDKARDMVRGELEAIQAKISRQQSVLAKETVLGYSRRRIEELRQDAQNAAQALESIEKMLFLAEEYTRHKTR